VEINLGHAPPAQNARLRA